jgi:pyrroline-5-carboxylate reductase
MKKQEITFIGAGNMAFSIAKGLRDIYDIEVVARDMSKLDTFEKNLNTKIRKTPLKGFNISDKIIILCVKPNNIQEVGKQLKGKCKALYSVLAGTSLEKLKLNIRAKSTVRTMPNLGASVGESMTTITGDITYQDEVIRVFNSIGKTLWLNSEKELDIATALAGSGPAYLALIAEALTDGAVKQGLKRDDAMEIMRGLFKGFGDLIQSSHPALLKDAVMSPAGTTAYGYYQLEKSGVRSGCIDAIESAYNRALELR